MVSRRNRQAPIKLGAFTFTQLLRAQLALAEQGYSTKGDLLRDYHDVAVRLVSCVESRTLYAASR